MVPKSLIEHHRQTEVSPSRVELRVAHTQDVVMRATVNLPAVLFASAALLAGCGGSSPTGPTLTYEDIAGTYTTNVTGTLPGNTLNAAIALNLQQSSAALSGGYTITATVNNGFPGQGTVTLTGTVAPGPNPAVN